MTTARSVLSEKDVPAVAGRPLYHATKLNVDHGHVTTTANRLLCGRNWTGQIGAQFQYEHNQDAGSVIGFSAGWGGLTLSYSGEPSVSKRGTNPSYFTVG